MNINPISTVAPPYIIDEFATTGGSDFTLAPMKMGTTGLLVTVVEFTEGGKQTILSWKPILYIVGSSAQGLTLNLPSSAPCILLGLPAGVMTPPGEISAVLKLPMTGGRPGSVVDVMLGVPDSSREE